MILRPQVGVRSPQVVVPKPNQTRGDFRRVEFDRLVHQLGYRASWQKAVYCPCVNNPDTEQPDVACTLCAGRGFVMGEAREIKVSLTRFGKNVSIFERFGEWALGTVYMTVLPEHKLAFRDRVTMLDSEIVFQEVVSGAGTALQKARYPIVGIEVLRSLTVIYEYEADFKLTAAGEVSWIIPPPPVGTRLSLRYRIRPPFVVLDHLNAFRDTRVMAKSTTDAHQEMPIQVLAKLEFLDKR